MAVTTLTKVGAFTDDLATQLNDNFSYLGSVSAGGTLTNGYMLVGNGSNVATAVQMSGDVTITNAGVAAIKTSVSLTTPAFGAATGASLVLTGDCRAATFHAGATAGATAGPFTTVSSIQTIGGIVTTLTGSA
jgi:hypothetical protein